MEFENRIYAAEEIRTCNIYTGDFRFNMLPGAYEATLILRAWGKPGTMKLFFQFDDGQKIISIAQCWQNYLDFYMIDTGSRVLLIYEEVSPGKVYLTGARVI